MRAIMHLTTVLLLVSTLALLTGCSITTNLKKMSWYEKQIEALNYKKTDLKIDLTTRIKNQKECEEYGKKNWGETEDNDNWHMFQKFMYSPIYDKCFVLRTADNYEDNTRQVIIFDLLSGGGGGIFLYQSWCRDWYAKNGIEMSDNDLEKECPTERQINDAWLSLLGE